MKAEIMAKTMNPPTGPNIQISAKSKDGKNNMPRSALVEIIRSLLLISLVHQTNY